MRACVRVSDTFIYPIRDMAAQYGMICYDMICLYYDMCMYAIICVSLV